ncbi:MAG: phosphatase PAP2 family protein [Paucibacter sp.]|nr:phosphatase PAP2 family protein [Roseateles sp.]
MSLFSLSSASVAPFWQLLTRLGEIQILLPLALLSALWLWRRSAQTEVAKRWMLALGLAMALTAASKLAFFGWGWGIAAWDFTGISGHAMASAAILPRLAWFALMGQATRLRYWGVGLGFGLAAMIAYSRLKVGAHSPAESIAGFLIGSVASLLSLRVSQPAKARAAPPLWLPVGMLAALLLLPLAAPKSRSHDWVLQLSMQLSGRAQPFLRGDLQRQPQAVPLSAASSSLARRRPAPAPKAAAVWGPALP